MLKISDIKEEYVDEWVEFETLIEESLISNNHLLNKINNYLLDNFGKQIRPLLVLVTAKACSGSINKTSLVCAAVSELIHTATLLHDDVVDDSDMRRGSLTVKSLFSPGASVLMGDYWLSKAIHLLISNNCNYEILRNYSKTIEDLAEGEMLQMERSEDLKTTFEDYFEIIKRKTASLFTASIKSAAIASDSPSYIVDALEKYAICLGLSFQIRDDILDYTSIQIGKDNFCDIEERKITLPLLCAMKNSPDKGVGILSIISNIDILNKENPKNIAIKDSVSEYVIKYYGMDDAKEMLKEYIDKAVLYLGELEESPSKSYLKDIVRSLII